MTTRLTVRSCIGCGALETPQPCIGACVEHPVVLVSLEDRRAVAARLAEAGPLDARLTELARAVLALPTGDEAALMGLRPQARELVLEAGDLTAAASLPDPEEARVRAWSCDTCGRVEAPQPCIGVCIRRPVVMVQAAEYDADRAALGAALARIDALVPIARALAWATPRAGHVAETIEALRRRVARLGDSGGVTRVPGPVGPVPRSRRGR